uniref:Calcium channel, voltage-dependent, T type, alpha 1H subunit a n=1 Tax=Xiphophorus couchianus TaxID=32473 RepID=A0A3B5MJY2_9TELE
DLSGFGSWQGATFFSSCTVSSMKFGADRSKVRSWLLAHVSMLVILLNCVTLGMFQPCEDVNCQSEWCRILQVLDDCIFAFFAVEMVIKMVALGIFGPNCYLGDKWNQLDFVIVMAGVMEYSLDGHNASLSAIRTVRVLRPLRAINRVPSMRILVTLLLDTLPMLGNVLLLCFFVFFIFGIVGVQLWAGLLRNRCFLGEDIISLYNQSIHSYYMSEEGEDSPFICSAPRENGMLRCRDVPPFTQGGEDCSLPAPHQMGGSSNSNCVNWNQYYNVCRPGEHNPHKGAVNFDNIGHDRLFLIVGSFFMINLCLVVIATQFSETKQRENALMREQRARYMSNDSTLASYSEPGSCYEEMLRYISHLYRKFRRRLQRMYYGWHRYGVGSSRGSGPGTALWLRPIHNLLQHHQHQHCHLSNGGQHTVNATIAEHMDQEGHAEGVEVLEMKTLSVPRGSTNGSGGENPAVISQGMGALLGRLNGGMNYPTILPSFVCSYSSKTPPPHSKHVCPDVFFQGGDLRGFRSLFRRRGVVACRNGAVQAWINFREKLRRIVESKYFNRGIMIAILVNTLSMGIEYHEQPDELTHVLEISNIVFTSMFVLEMGFMLLAFGLFGYIRNPYNIFDSIIVIISVWEIIGQADGGLSVLRTFRLLRVLKLVRFLPALRRQLVVLMKTMDNVATFCMLLMLFIFTFSILGMHLFGCKFSQRMENGDTIPDRKNFDSLLWAIVTVFQILTQEDWNVVLYNGMASTSPWAALYFVALMTFGNYVLFNLLVAILVEGFQAEVRMAVLPFLPLQTLSSPGRRSPLPLRGSISSWGSRRSSWNSLGRAPSLKRRDTSGERESLLSGEGGEEEECQEQQEEAGVNSRVKLESLEPLQASSLCPTIIAEYGDCNGRTVTYDPNGNSDPKVDFTSDDDLDEDLRATVGIFIYDSLCLFRVRVWCQAVITHKLFDHVVLVFIFLNCITIALERPDILPHSPERVFLSVSNYIFTVIFLAEMAIKVVALGFCFGNQTYLQSSWNVLDGVLVFVSLVDILVSLAYTVLRLLRTLRPLRYMGVISRAPGLKLVVETLITSLRPIGNIVLICCAFFIVFGILGVQLFKGKFYHCEGLDTKNVTNRSDCELANYKWIRRKYNFDNLIQALMSLFVLSCKDGWVNIMYDGLDAVGVNQQPVRNHNPWMLLYFISFLLIVSFFVLNMFVGVVVENFHKCRQDQEEEEARLREEKRLKMIDKKRRKAKQRPYYADYSPLRLTIHTLCTSHYLDLFITFIICINVFTMSIEHYNQPQYLEEVLKYCNYVFTIIFVIEALLKLVAFGFHRFFKDRWNQLDVGIVALSILGITLEELKMKAALPINPTIIRIMRVLRIARVLKLLKMAKGMRALLDTVMQALPQVGNLGLLFMLLFFIYAALGVELFGKLECSDSNPCEGLSRHATFENFGMAFLTLFRVSTGDNWNGIMKDTLRDCQPDEVHCLSYLPWVSPIYFVTFVLMAQFVLVNVVVAVLMKHLEESNKESSHYFLMNLVIFTTRTYLALNFHSDESHQELITVCDFCVSQGAVKVDAVEFQNCEQQERSSSAHLPPRSPLSLSPLPPFPPSPSALSFHPCTPSPSSLPPSPSSLLPLPSPPSFLLPPPPSPRLPSRSSSLRRPRAPSTISLSDPADAEVYHITSSACHRWRDAEGGEQENRRKAGRSHSLSPYASPHSLDLIPTLPPPSNRSTLSLHGAGSKDVKKGFSVDHHGFLEKPQLELVDHSDDQRRHSIEVCLPQAVITTDSQNFMLETHRSEKGAQAFPMRVQSVGGRQRKKKTSPPCISIHPPTEREHRLLSSPPKLADCSMTLRRRTSSNDFTQHSQDTPTETQLRAHMQTPLTPIPAPLRPHSPTHTLTPSQGSTPTHAQAHTPSPAHIPISPNIFIQPHAPLLPTVMPFSQTVSRHSPLAGDCIPLSRFTFDQPQSRYVGEPESVACSSPFDNRLGSSPGFSAKNRRTAQ